MANSSSLEKASVAASTGKRYALYTRVSTERQLEGVEFNSLESQETFLRRWVTSKAGTIVDVYKDTESGTTLQGRPGLVRLLQDAYAKKYDIAVVYNSDRWARSVEIHAQLKGIERQTGVRFVSATEHFDDSPVGKMVETFLAAAAQFQSDNTSLKVKAKRRELAIAGLWSGGRTPFGYRSVAKRLEVSPEEGPTLQRIFDLFIELRSAVAVRNRLRDLGLTNRDGAPWSNTTIEAILRNPIYISKLRDCGGEVFLGKHPALVTEEIWNSAQRVSPNRRRNKSKVQRSYPLLGLLWCGHCDRQMTTHYVQKKNGKRIPRYRCTVTSKHSWSDCPHKEVHADRIEAWVSKQLERLSLDGDLLTRAIAQANAASEERNAPVKARLKEVCAGLKNVQSRVDNLLEAVTSSGRRGLALVEAKLALEEQSLRQLETEEAALKATLASQQDEDPIEAGKVRRALRDFRLLYDVASAKEREDLLQMLVARITYNGPEQETVISFRADVQPRGSKLRTIQLPKLARSENFVSVFEVLVERAKRKSRSKRIGPPKAVRFLAMAEEFQRLLEAGEVRSRAELARRNDLQRARVTQLMDLLELHPLVREFVRGLDGTTPERAVTERKLKALTSLPQNAQLVAARRRLPGFLTFESRRRSA